MLFVAVCVFAGGNQSSVLSILPSDITLVYSLNIKQAEKTEMTELFGRAGIKELEMFAADSGVDLAKETESVAIGVREMPDGEKAGVTCYTVITGDFSADTKQALSGKGEDAGKTVAEEKFLGMDIFTFTQAGISVCFTDRDTLVSGTAESVKEMIQIKKRKARPASSNSAWMWLIPRADRNSVMWAAFRNDLKKPAREGEESRFPGNFQVRPGGRWRPGAGNRIIGALRENELTQRELQNMASVQRELMKYKALGIENKLVSRVLKSGGAAPSILFSIYLEYSDPEQTASLAKDIRQAQNFIKTASFKESDLDWKGQELIVDMLGNTQAQAKGNILRMRYVCEKKNYETVRQVFSSMFLKGLQKGLMKRFKQAGRKKKAEKDKKVIRSEVPF